MHPCRTLLCLMEACRTSRRPHRQDTVCQPTSHGSRQGCEGVGLCRQRPVAAGNTVRVPCVGLQALQHHVVDVRRKVAVRQGAEQSMTGQGQGSGMRRGRGDTGVGLRGQASSAWGYARYAVGAQGVSSGSKGRCEAKGRLARLRMSKDEQDWIRRRAAAG